MVLCNCNKINVTLRMKYIILVYSSTFCYVVYTVRIIESQNGYFALFIWHNFINRSCESYIVLYESTTVSELLKPHELSNRSVELTKHTCLKQPFWRECTHAVEKRMLQITSQNVNACDIIK